MNRGWSLCQCVCHSHSGGPAVIPHTGPCCDGRCRACGCHIKDGLDAHVREQHPGMLDPSQLHVRTSQD